MTQRGIALLMVLWILTFLTVMALSFSLLVRTEAYSALSFKNETENKYLAEAGIQRGMMEIFHYNANKNLKIVLSGSEISRTDGREYTGSAGKGHYAFRIIDESGKININALSDSTRIIFYNLLVNYGLPGEQAEVIADSVLDWKDADELHRLNGAESDYYMSLPDPYKSKNGNYDTPEELLLVKGMTPEILYGDEEGKNGILDFITVHSQINRVNLKAAPKEVLAAVPGFNSDLAESIITLRETVPEEISLHLQASLGKSYEESAPYIGAEDSNTFTIDAVGYTEDKKKGYSIRSTVIIENNNKSARTVYYKSPA
jgi:general secretion pathway protein K